MKAVKIILGVLVALIVAILLIVQFALGGIIKGAVNKIGPEALGAPVSIEGVTVSPFSGFVHFKGFVIGNPEGFHTDSAAKLSEFKVKLDLPSLLTDKIIIKEILVDGAQVTFEKSLRSSNFATLQQNVEEFAASFQKPTTGEEAPAVEEKPAEKSEKPAKNVQIDKLLITNGKVSFSITAFKGQAISLPLPTINREGIGADEPDGATMGEAIKAVFDSLSDAVTNVSNEEEEEFIENKKEEGRGIINGLFKKKEQ